MGEAVPEPGQRRAVGARVAQLCTVLSLEDCEIRGAFLSGAGPSGALLARRDFPRLEQLLRSTYEQAGCPVTVRTLGVHQSTEVAADELAAAHGRTV